MNINILESVPRLWFENTDGDRQIPPLNVQNDLATLDLVQQDQDPGGFIYLHTLIHSVIGYDIVKKDDNGELQLVTREYLPFDHKFVEGLVRNGDMDLRTAMFIAVEACERCQAGLRCRYKFGVGYPFGGKAYRENESRCRICYVPQIDTDPPEWFTPSMLLRIEQEGS